MAPINEAMAASLRSSGGWLLGRDIASEAQSVKTSFSSWDNCMNAAYCKWPVIVAIIIGSLIVLSVVWCIVRCACCAKSCCCECFSCLACCGDCCGCCTPPADRRHKHLDDNPYPPNQGYRAPAPMMAGGVGGYEPPKFAQFETGPSGLAVEPKKVSDDALPPMPSWDGAAKKRVMTEDGEGVEMGELDHKTGQQVPLMSGAGGVSRSNSPAISPLPSPYGDQGQAQDYMGAQGPPGTAPMAAGALGGAAAGAAMGAAMGGRGNGRDPYGRGQGPPGPPGQRPYSPMNGQGRDYGPPGGPQGQPVSPISPVDGRGPMGQGYPPSPQSPPFGPGQSPYPPDNFNGPNNGPNNGYGPPGQGQGPIGGFIAAGGPPGQGGPRGPPSRQYSNDSNRPYPPGPYNNNPMNQSPSPPLNNQRNYSNDSGRPLVMPIPGPNGRPPMGGPMGTPSPPPNGALPLPPSNRSPYSNDRNGSFSSSPRNNGPPPPPSGLDRQPSPPVLQPNGQFDFGLGSGGGPSPPRGGPAPMPGSGFGGPNNRRPSPPSNNNNGSYGPRGPSRSPPPQELPGSVGAGRFQDNMSIDGRSVGTAAPSYHTVDPYSGPGQNQGGQGYPGYRAYAPQR